MTQELLWTAAVDRLKSRVSPQNFDMWLRPIELMSWDGATVRLRAPNSYVRLWFESNFLSSLVKELHELGHDQVRIEFDPDGERQVAIPALADPTPQPFEMPMGSVPTATRAMEPPAPPLAPAPTPKPPVEDDVTISAPDAATLNHRYTFDTFVAGQSNHLAFAA